VRNAEGGRLLDTRQRFDRAIDFHRGNLLAAAIDDFLEAPGDMDVPVRVDATQVAGAEPPAAERRRSESGSSRYPRKTSGPRTTISP
jgi:hypothetical protein